MSAELKRHLLIATGTICLAIGVIGIFTPILPTTPFLLLAAACYLRSSPRFHSWLMNNRIFGTYIRNYTEGRGIPLRVKLFTIALLWVTIGISIWATANLIVTAVLLVVAVGVTLHIVFIRAKKDKPT
ncbi:Inner membrane protein YbaN [subsurface metagenome]